MKLIDLLEKTEWFDGELYAEDCEVSDFSFVWDGDIPLTEYGKEFFADVVQAEVLRHDDSEIWIGCENNQKFDDFLRCVAGYCSCSFYSKCFDDKFDY